jgi:peptide/nickel transport system substrate-binding protein
MLKNKIVLCAALVSLCVLAACKKKDASEKSDNPQSAALASTLVLSERSDVDFFNPIISQTVPGNNAISMIYPSLIAVKFDTAKGYLVYEPLVAKSWTISPDNKSITYNLRGDVKWTDGTPVTARDFKFSYQLYGDTAIASARQDHLEHFVKKLAKKGKSAEKKEAFSEEVDLDRAILTPNDTTLIFNFDKSVAKHVIEYQTSLPPVPKHVWEKIAPKDFRASEINSAPTVSCGAFAFKDWKRQQEFTVVSNPSYNLPAPGKIPTITTRIVPEYTTLLTQLKTGAIDVLEGIKPEDAIKLEKENPEIEVKQVKYRGYSYMMLSNIDCDAYKNGKQIKPHPLFGTKKTRLAIAMAIDREKVLDGYYFGKYAELMTSPISPAFKWAYNNDLKPYPFDMKRAKELLAEDGWKIGSDGILERNGKKFSFTLFNSKGGTAGEYMAPIIQSSLKELGIECNIEVIEFNEFIKRGRTHAMDASLNALFVGLEIDLLPAFGSNLDKSAFNSSGYINPRIDELNELGQTKLNRDDAVPYWKEFQKIFYDDVPFVPMFWSSRIIGFNKRVLNERPDILSTYIGVEDWQLSTMSAKPAQIEAK